MAESKFRCGRLNWLSETVDSDTLRSRYLAGQSWSNGFLAFSVTEQRLSDVGIDKLSSLLDGRSDANGGPEGYLMEVGLWRSVGERFEELAIEREGDSFTVQHWNLETSETPAEGMECFYRPARTFARGNVKPFSGTIDSFEVVVPEHRLRIYLTRGE